MQLVFVFLFGEGDTVPTNPHAKPDHSNIPSQYQHLVGKVIKGQVLGYAIKPSFSISIWIDRGEWIGTRVAYPDTKDENGLEVGFERVRFTVKWDGKRLIATNLAPC